MIKKIKKIDSQLYSNIAMNDLVMYAITLVGKKNNEIIYEDIIAAAFYLFPDKFSLQSYDKWPDSSVINKRIVDIRHKNMISGSVAKGFIITLKGKKIAENVGKIISKEIVISNKKSSNKEERSRAQRFLNHIKKSEIFIKYKKEKNFNNINEFDFRSLLLCPMESSPSVLNKNFNDIKDHMEILKNESVLEFLDKCFENFSHLLKNKYNLDEKAGMLKRKIK